MHIPAALLKRVKTLEQESQLPIFTAIVEWDVTLLEPIARYTPETADAQHKRRVEEDRRRAAIDEAIDALLERAQLKGLNHFAFRVQGTDSGQVQLVTTLGTYTLDVPCLPGRARGCGHYGPAVFLYYADDDPSKFHYPTWGIPKQRALARYGLKG